MLQLLNEYNIELKHTTKKFTQKRAIVSLNSLQRVSHAASRNFQALDNQYNTRRTKKAKADNHALQ